jgi:hypothetical protein
MKTAIILLALLCAGCSRDDTDPPGGRSGLIVKTDAATGCQYLNNGGITPRIAEDGKTHYGCRGAK